MSGSGFSDHFSAGAAEYARVRPNYPPALFSWLALQAPARDLAWDCATGSGQAAVALAEHVRQVWATDASPEQIAHARPHPRVCYGVATAERSGLADRSVDLVTVAQALHWLDLPSFYAEVQRVLRPGGVLAVWGYGDPVLQNPELDAALAHFNHEVVGPFWPTERQLLLRGYRDLPFPFAELATPGWELRAELTLDHLASYVGTWSSTSRFRAARAADPVPALVAALRPHWGDSSQPRTVRWPMPVRVGRNG